VTPTDLWALAKPRISAMVGVATALGYVVAARGLPEPAAAAQAAGGAALASAGTAALNQWFERGADARMRRTADRPLPSGRLSGTLALGLGLAWLVGGVAWLTLANGWLPALLAALSAVTYLGCYTPLKSRSYWCVTVGALPGALPPLIGWAAATGGLSAVAWTVFAWIVIWQFPHVAALVEIHRVDYARVGWRMDPLGPIHGPALVVGLAVSVAVMIGCSLLPLWLGSAGGAYAVVALVLGLAFGGTVWRFARRPDRAGARLAFVASIVYLPVVLATLALDACAR